MDTVTIMANQVQKNHDDKTQARGLIDLYQEERNVAYSLAVKRVAALRVGARRQRLIERAGMLLKAHHFISIQLKRVVRAAVDLEGFDTPLYICAGFRPPTIVDPVTYPDGSAMLGTGTIVVGARWLHRVRRCIDLYEQGQHRHAQAQLPWPMFGARFVRSITSFFPF